MLLTGLAFAATMGRDPLDARVTFALPAESVEHLASDLSTKTGIRFSASVQTKDEIVFVHVKDVSIRALMSHLAQATDAVWTPDGPGYRLDRTPEIRRREEEKAIQIRTKAFAAAIEVRKKQVAEMGAFDEATAFKLSNDYYDILKEFNDTHSYTQAMGMRSEKMSQSSPSNRFLIRVISEMDPRALASLPNRKRAVLSSRPTAMQFPLPANINSELVRFQKEENLWAETSKPILSRVTASLSVTGLGNAIIPKDISKVLFMLHDLDTGGTGYVTMKVVDTNGHVVAEGWIPIAAPTQANTPAAPVAKLEPTFKVSWSPDSVAIRQCGYSQGASKPIPPELAAKLVQPETIDPLSFNTTDMLNATAEGLGKNVVVELDDSLFPATAWFNQSELTKTLVADRLGYSGIELADADGWLVGSPIDGIQARHSNVDRRALGEYLRGAKAVGRATLDLRAAYALGLDPEAKDIFSRPFLYMVGIVPSGNEMEPLDELRVYGCLSPTQRKAATNGVVQVRFGTMPVRGADAIKRIIYDREGSLRSRDNRQVAEGGSRIVGTGLTTEPTEALPNGIPSATEVDFALSENDVISPAIDSKDGQSAAVSPGQDASGIAWGLFGAERPDLGYNASGLKRSDLEKVHFGTNTVWRTTIQCAPLLTSSFSLLDQVMGPVIPYNQLPERFRTSVEDTLKQFRENYKNVKTGGTGTGGGGTTPPGR